MLKNNTNKKIKILFVHHTGLITGSAISLYNLLKELDRGKYEPIVLLTLNGPTRLLFESLNIKVYHSPLRHIWEAPNPPFYDVYHNFTNWLAFIPNIRLYHLLLAINPDIIHINDTALVSAIITAYKLKIPVVTHVRSVVKRTPKCSLRVKILLFLVSKLSNRIISIGEEYCDQFISKDKIVVIYNSLDFENLNSLLSNNIDIKKNIYNDSNSILIGFVGLVTYYKGIWDFIDSAEILLKQNIKNIKFIICGRVPKSTFIDKIINYLQRGYLISPADYIKSLNHKNNFILVNQTEEILKIINSFDILVSCEGTATGRPIIEAQALGKPVVAVLPSENTKVLLNGITGLIVQGHDVNLLASAIKKLIIEPGLRKKMGELGRNHAEENFDSKKNILKIQEIYDIILEGKKSTKDL